MRLRTPALVVLAPLACVSSERGNQALTYFKDAAPIIERRCVNCHSRGQIGPFPLTSYEDVAGETVLIKAVLQARRMPPFPPDQTDCAPLDDFRNISEDERKTLVAWIESGAAKGDPKTAPPPQPSEGLGPPSMELDSGLDYLSTYPGQDEYRCFVLDPGLTEQLDVIAASVRSTSPSIVHHTVVVAQLPKDRQTVDMLDAADPLPGYECFGGVGFDGIGLSGAAVGTLARAFPDGSGQSVPPGIRIVVQVHYNFDNGRTANRFYVDLWKAKGSLTHKLHPASAANTTFFIPAGAPDTEATALSTFTAAIDSADSKEGNLWQILPHMHQLGKSIRVDLLRADGSRQCLLNLPAWNFHWQGVYQVKQAVPVRAGDHLRVTCHWDNSAANQPINGGQQQVPRNVQYGLHSTDEMCLAVVILTDYSLPIPTCGLSVSPPTGTSATMFTYSLYSTDASSCTAQVDQGMPSGVPCQASGTFLGSSLAPGAHHARVDVTGPSGMNHCDAGWIIQ